MAENDDPTRGMPASAHPPAPPTANPIVDPTAEQTVVVPAGAPADPAQARTRFTERVWNFQAMVAVALAALLLGGGIGAAISAVSHDGGSDGRPGYARFGGGPPGLPGGPGGPGLGQQQRQFRHDLKDLRQRMKERLKQNAPTPTPTAPTPSPTKTS